MRTLLLHVLVMLFKCVTGAVLLRQFLLPANPLLRHCSCNKSDITHAFLL
jgi:hypothetical protein